MLSGNLPAYLLATSQATYDSATSTIEITGPTTFIGDPVASQYAPPIVIATGAAAVVDFATTAGSQVRLASLSLTDGASAAITNPSASPVVLEIAGGLTIDVTGALDIGFSDLDIGGSSLAAVQAFVARGYDLAGGGNWKGTGITSSAAAADTTHTTAVGVVSNTSTDYSTFDGDLSVGASDVLVKHTYFGDANLDGKVDGSDYSLIDAGAGATGWYHGDFNYDGVVDGSDYALIDNAFNESAPKPPQGPETEDFPYFTDRSDASLNNGYVITQTVLPATPITEFTPSLFSLGGFGEMRGAFQGSSASITIYSNNTNNTSTGASVFVLIVDGVATTPTVPAGQETTLPLLIDGTDTVHQWSIVENAGFAGDLYLGTDGVTVTGDAPAVIMPAGFSGVTVVNPVPSNIQVQPDHGFDGLNITVLGEGGAPGGGIEFYTAATTIPVNVEGGGLQTYGLEYDGPDGWVVGGEQTAGGYGQFVWVFFSGLPAGSKLVRIFATGPELSNWTIGSLGVVPLPWTGPASKTAVFFGDSRIADTDDPSGIGTGAPTAINSAERVIGRATGLFVSVLASDGAAIESGTGAQSLDGQTNEYLSWYAGPTDVAVLESGFNDTAGYSHDSGTTASTVLANISSAITTWVNAVLSTNPAIEIVIATPTQGYSLPVSAFDAVDNTVYTAATAAFDSDESKTSATLKFVDNYTAFTYGDMRTDTIHETGYVAPGQVVSGDQVYGQAFTAGAFLGAATGYTITLEGPTTAGQPATGTITFNGEPVCVAASYTSPSIPLSITLTGTGCTLPSAAIQCTSQVTTFTFIPTAASGSILSTNSQSLSDPMTAATFGGT